jgi:hypothetical protein
MLLAAKIQSPVFTFDVNDNTALLDAGAQPFGLLRTVALILKCHLHFLMRSGSSLTRTAQENIFQ